MWYVYMFILYSCFSECDLSKPQFISPGQCETENISCSRFREMWIVWQHTGRCFRFFNPEYKFRITKTVLTETFQHYEGRIWYRTAFILVTWHSRTQISWSTASCFASVVLFMCKTMICLRNSTQQVWNKCDIALKCSGTLSWESSFKVTSTKGVWISRLVHSPRSYTLHF